MATRENVINNHVSGSNLKETIDISENGNMIAVEYSIISDLVPGSKPFLETLFNYGTKEDAWKKEFQDIDRKLGDAGLPPLSDAERKDLQDRFDQDYPDKGYTSPQDVPKDVGEGVAWGAKEAWKWWRDEYGEPPAPEDGGAPLPDLPPFEWPVKIPLPEYVDTGTSCEPFPDVNTKFNDANQWFPRYDPLALDLDGDGVETIGADAGVVFDFDGDGLKTGTGWVKSDDGFLVLDRNGNGSIDNGGELFGVDTIKNNGQKAVNGFDALSDLNSNGNNVFDAQDAEYDSVRIWRDTNQDGIAQSHELKSLAQYDITSISLESVDVNQGSNGNVITATGTYVRGDGSSGDVNGNQSQAANLELAVNPFYREYLDKIALDDEAESLPGMKGSGAVRDLREASMLNPDLKRALTEYQHASSRSEQLSLIDKVLAEWAATSSFRTFDQRIGDLSTGSSDVAFAYSWELPWASERPTEAQLEKQRLLELVKVLEIFNSQQFFKVSGQQNVSSNGNETFQFSSVSGSVTQGKKTIGFGLGEIGKFYITEGDFSLSVNQANLLEEAYESLRQSVYQGLLLQTRLKPYIEAVSLVFTNDSAYYDFSEATALFQARHAQERISTTVDLVEFSRKIKGSLSVWLATVEEWIADFSAEESAAFSLQLGGAFKVSDLSNGGYVDGTVQTDVLMGGLATDVLQGNQGDDVLLGGGGADNLNGGDGSDILIGGEGADKLYGGAGSDILYGGSGDDYLNGGGGSDVYVFGIGSGSDLIYNYDTSSSTDVIVLGEGINEDNIRLSRKGSDLLITVAETNDSLRVQSFFVDDAQGGYSVYAIQFPDGNAWSLEHIKNIVMMPAPGLSKLEGYASGDSISGGTESESIYGHGGNDTLSGEGGDDFIDGGAGDDILSGGVGNDNLVGGAGSDIYRIGLDSGHDIINNYDTSVGRADRIVFDAGILPNDVYVVRSGSDLLLQINDGASSVRVRSFFLEDAAGGHQIDEFEFFDGTKWSSAEIKTKVLTATLEGDRLTGYASDDIIDGGFGDDQIEGLDGNDTLIGGGGNDSLYGGRGNDILRGEGGNDYLDGGEGSDTYLFGRGSGHDRISNFDRSDARLDVIKLEAGISVSDVLLSRGSNQDLVLRIKDSGDTVSVSSFFHEDGASRYVIDRIEFADGTNWDVEDIKQRVLSPTDAADTIRGYAGNDLIDGGFGDDAIFGFKGDDTLLGGSGSDRLDGGDGNDILDGGIGNDSLIGGEGSDTYVFGRGFGQDVINNFDRSPGSEDVIQLSADVLPTDVRLTRLQNKLILSIQGSDDTLTVEHYFESDATDGYQIDRVVFADGTSWDVEAVKQLVQAGTHGADNLYGYATDDVLDGFAGDDSLYGNAGNDHLSGGDGDDYLSGDAGNDTLLGGNGDDQLSGGIGENLLDGGSGNDRYLGGEKDTYIFRQGNDHDRVSGLPAEATIQIEGYNLEQLLLRRNGENLVASFLANGQDTLTFERFFDGNTPHRGLTLKDAVGNVEVLDLQGVNARSLVGSTGDDHIQANDLDNSISAGDGVDHIEGFAGDDLLDGGAGDDLLQGGQGNDTLVGGSGNDHLQGGQGDDLYRFAAGSGNDLVQDESGIDSLHFIDAVPADVVLRRDKSDLVISRTAIGDQIRIKDQFSFQAGVHGKTPVESILFADGTSWDIAQIKQMALAGTDAVDEIFGHSDDDLVHAGAGDDIVHGQEGGDEVYGGDGNDTLNGGDGNDTLFGDAGDDLLSGDWGDDQLRGGDGNDTLYGGSGSDHLYGEAGDDHLYGDGVLEGGSGADFLEGSGLLIGGDGNDTLKGLGFDTLQGGAGNDVIEAYSDAWNQGANTIEGGTGNDSIYGSFGEDTYIFNLGDGHDLLIERRPDEAYSNIEPTADTLSFGDGIAPTDLSFHRRGLDMIIEHANGTDSITVQNWFKEPNDHFKLEHFVFADGSELSQAEVEGLVIWDGTDAVDSFIGYRDLNDTMLLGAGDDKAWGRAGNDVIQGEGGSDYLDGEAGNDTVYGGAGNDQLMGGTGNDLLLGGIGDDKYVYKLGDGVDTINNTGGGNDGLFFSGGIDEARLTFTRDGDDLLILVDEDAEQSVRVQGHFLGGDKAISYVQPDGGFLINAARIAQIVAAGEVPGGFDTLVEGTETGEQLAGGQGNDLVRGLAGNDTLFGMGGDDQIEGGDGNDYLSGGNGSQSGSGNDVLIGGTGSDTLDGEDGDDQLAGGVGDDKYYYRANGGVDVIDNSGSGFDGVFFIGIARTRLSFHREGDDLLILVDGDLGQQVRVTDHFLGGDFAIDYVQPDGGSYLTTAQIASLLTAIPGTEEPEVPTDPEEPVDPEVPTDPEEPTHPEQPPVADVGGDDVVTGTSGNDLLLGGAGNDELKGMAGNDQLIGGIGDDRYVYSGGQDVLVETGGSDTLVFSNGITFNQVASGMMKSGNDLVLRVNGSTANQVTLRDFFLGGDDVIETMLFETGGQLTAAQIYGAFGMAMPTPVSLFDQTVQGSAGNDAALDGADGRDLLKGFNGNDLINGKSGADRLEGGNGNDTLNGGAGNDVLIGGRGDDTYVFTAGSGQDTIDNSGGGVDVLRFEGITFNQVGSGLMKSGNDLVLNVSGGTDKVTIKNWFLGGDYAIDTLTFASGGQLTASQIFGAFGLANPDPAGSPAYQGVPDERGFGTVLNGQAGDQNIIGSSDADLIDGGAGNDVIRGALGDDYLTGGDGSDTYRFALGDGRDVINNLSNNAAADNDVVVVEGLSKESLWLSKQGNNLVIDVTGSDDSITIQDWYLDPAQRVDTFVAGSSALHANAVDNLVNAMAAFGAPSGGELVLSQTQRDELNVVIAANWQ